MTLIWAPCCSAALDFDAEGLPCRDRGDCPAPATDCIQDRCARPVEVVSGAGAGGDQGEIDGGEDGIGDGGDRAGAAPRAGAVVAQTPLDGIRSPLGLTGPLGLREPLWAGEFVDDEVVTAPGGERVCSLPDVGMRGLTRLDDGTFVSLHDGALFLVDPADDCASRRLVSIDEGHDLAWDGTDLLQLKRTWLLHRDPATGGERRQRTLADQPQGTTKMAALEGLLFLAGARPSADGSGFVVVVAVYDLTSPSTALSPASTFDIDIDASSVSGVHASANPTRLWILTSGSGSEAGRLIEVSLTI